MRMGLWQRIRKLIIVIRLVCFHGKHGVICSAGLGDVRFPGLGLWLRCLHIALNTLQKGPGNMITMITMLGPGPGVLIA